MSPDLTYLVWAAALTVLQMVMAAMFAAQQCGLPKLVGNREDLPPLTGIAGRAQRAHRNMLESLVLFAVLVLVAQAAGKANAATATGSLIFFWARVVYALVYLVGIPWLRTGVWAVSMAGLVVIFLQLV